MSDIFNGVISIKPLKTFACEDLPAGSVLRELILEEPERLPVLEFVIKVKVWLRLLRRIEN
jgi:hypothetical protein